MQQHLQRLDGVAKAEVSLLDGRVTVYPKEGASLDPYRILKATYDSGVSVAEMEMTASGQLQESGGNLLFMINNQQSFGVTPNALSERLKAQAQAPGDRHVSLRGRLYQKPPGGGKPKTLPEQLRIEILEILPGNPGGP